MTNKTCFTCIYSFGAIEHLKDHSTLICWPSGNQDREQLAHKLCDEYVNEIETMKAMNKIVMDASKKEIVK